MSEMAEGTTVERSPESRTVGTVRYLFGPLGERRVWAAVLYNLLDFPVAWAAGFLIGAAVVVATGFIPAAVLVVPATLVLVRGAGGFERARARTLLGVDVEAPPMRPPATRFVDRLIFPVKDVFAWRALGYFVVKFAFGNVAFFVTIGIAWGAAVSLTMPIWADTQARGTLAFELGGWAYVLAVVAGVVLLAVGPRIVRGIATLSGELTKALLGPISEERIRLLEGQRSSAVRAADVDRRRIEQDLHDGAQVRLTALALQIGLAREAVAEGADAARVSELLDDAHAQAKQALREIRDLARGIHPAILTDRGLDAALTSMVGRLQVPIDLEVDVDERPSPEVESIVYFVAAEAVTNAVRHSDSPAIGLRVVRAGDQITVEVRDRGRGGADPVRGTGLTNLRERVEAAGGELTVQSPEGVGTLVRAVVPCE